MQSGRSRQGQGGFTLVELIITMAIGGLLLSVVTVMMLQMQRLTAVHQESLRLSHELQQAASVLNRDVVGAVAGEVQATDDGVTLTLEILTIPTFGAGADPQPRNVTYTYAEAEQTLRRTDSSGSFTVARRVTELDLGPSRDITTTLWVTMTVAGREQEQQMTLELHRRLDATP